MNIILSFIFTILISIPLIPIATLLSLIPLMLITSLLDIVKLKNKIFLRYMSRWVISFLCWGFLSYMIESFSFNSRVVSFTFILIWIYTLSSLSKIPSNRYFLFEVLKGNSQKYNIHTFFIVIFSIMTYYVGNFSALFLLLRYAWME